MHRRSRLAALVIASAAAALGGVTATASPSGAATTYLHMWTDDGYKGRTLGRQTYDSNFGNDWFCNPPGDRGWYYTNDPDSCPVFSQKIGFDDAISSIKNDTPYWWKTFHDRDYKGYVMCVRPYGYDNNIGNNTPEEDDISSVKRSTYDPDKNDQPGGCDQVIG